MGLKRKLATSVMSASLGLSLVGGGTWAAFNDVENIENTFAAGTLDLAVITKDKSNSVFKLLNMKPGDSKTAEFELKNDGSLAIKEVLLDITVPEDGFKNGENEYVNEHGGEENEAIDFLEQFQVEILRIDEETGYDFTLIEEKDGVTLADFAKKDLPAEIETVDGAINLAPIHTERPEYTGLPVNPLDDEVVKIKIVFVEDDTIDDSVPGEYLQNRYQGDEIELNFGLEATQWGGLDIQDGDVAENGTIERNKNANSETPKE
ncbi:TasA family protein [Aureibacillus halotolerans]|uniref:Camelysin n=1 Tax=Aureibacillus halotolerans TaxID=1508390 RepID=A0A4R6UFZ6_9BACI|nr:TasA family protein [Aureibacillus halotolerans]TDQ42064.1 camelysin [Aureibacillus halotolerans]